MLGEYVVEMDSYRRIVEDQAVADAELDAQTQRVTSLLRQLEEALSTEAAAVATEVSCELAVLKRFASQAPASRFYATAQ